MGSFSRDNREFTLLRIEQQAFMLGPFINQVNASTYDFI